VHVAAAQCGKKANVGDRAQRPGRAHRDRLRLRQRRPAQHDDHRTGTIAAGAGDLRQRISVELRAGQGARHDARVLRQSVRHRREVDDRHAELHRGAAHAQVEHGELLFEVRPQQHDRRRAIAVGDLGAG
jgi:hypothetical protein